MAIQYTFEGSVDISAKEKYTCRRLFRRHRLVVIGAEGFLEKYGSQGREYFETSNRSEEDRACIWRRRVTGSSWDGTVEGAWKSRWRSKRRSSLTL